MNKGGRDFFTISDRQRVHERVLQLAAADPRIVAGAVVGSLALSDGDRWSDLDLTFGVAQGLSIFDVLEEWTQALVREFDAVQLFDLPSGPSIYRVFLLPGCLQFDLSFTPAPQFGARGPKFRLLFGESVETPYAPQQPASDLLGYAVHHLLRARFCIQRGRLWQAEYWISSARDYALSLACRRRGLPDGHGRGFDDLPLEARAPFEGTFIAKLERDELLRALRGVIAGLLGEATAAGEEALREMAHRVEPSLRTLANPLYE